MRRALSFVIPLLLPFCVRAGVGDHADVMGAERLFETWIRASGAFFA
jgi:hypothetical protein